MSNSIRVGLIGLGGHMVRSLLPNILANPDLTVVAATDLNDENRKHVAQIMPGISFYESAEGLFESKLQDDLDAVIIAVDPDGHASLTRQALMHDLHVFVEKPACGKSQSLKELAKLAHDKKRHVMVGTMWRYTTVTKLLREQMQGKKPVSVTIDATFPEILKRPGWDVDSLELALYDMFIHPIDYACFWGADTDNLKVTHVQNSNGNIIAANILMDGKESIFSLNLSTGTTGYHVYVSFQFEDGTHAQIHDMQKLVVNPSETWTGTTGSFRDRPEMVWSHGNLYRGYGRHGYCEEFKAFVDCLNGTGPNLSNLNEAEKTMKQLQKCLLG